MVKIAFVLLCHKEPEAVISQARRLTAAGDCVAIHYDAKSPATEFQKIEDALRNAPNVVFAKRVKCGWGEWSLVQATLNAVSAADEAFPDATHFYLLSGDCMPIKTAEYAHRFLGDFDRDYIESFDFFESGWIKTGMQEDRLVYRHFLNERAHKDLFYFSLALQKRLGLRREVPEDIDVMIGSQWWCLRRETIEKILDFVGKRRDVVRFFKSTWIPDEIFFQTLVRHLVADSEIESRPLTFLMFTDYGMPVTFHNDHYDLLLAQDGLFARKISAEAHQLKSRLGELYSAEGVAHDISNEGRALHAFLTSRGREGRRFGRRIWDRESSIGPDRDLLIISAKKWHLAKRLTELIHARMKIPAVAFLFDEEDTGLPLLGGMESTVEKRGRHRRSFVRMLFEHFDTNRLVICIDPSRFHVIEDFYQDRARTRLLLLDCAMPDEYLTGHAYRVGIAGANSSGDTLARLLPAVRGDIEHEIDRIRGAGFPDLFQLREGDDPSQYTLPLAQFLDITMDEARDIASSDNLFRD
ncbi:MAG: beta-1,6-N-acetylglucosaminyltransferase [Paracoccaceae bacterium]|nr:beta-1,6-N-acetylglucosaminyltransferase [Paracoccaceae bacterium]